MHWAALTATLVVTLTACGGGSEPGATAAPSSLSASATATAPQPTAYTVPDVTGNLFRDGVSELYDFGIPKITLGDSERIAKEVGAKEISDADDLATTSSDSDQQKVDEYLIYKTDPEAGTTLEVIDSITVYIKLPLSPEAKASVWLASCLDMEDMENKVELPPVYTLKDIWKFTKGSAEIGCDFDLKYGKTFKPNKAEATAIQVASGGAKDWRGDDNGFAKYASILDYCVYYNPLRDVDNGDLNYVKAAAMTCPDSPFYKNLEAWGNGKKYLFKDGTHVVREDMPAGTYQTLGPATDCYWERATPNGRIIANDFITYAAKGAVATLRKGESFISKECGIWQKQ